MDNEDQTNYIRGKRELLGLSQIQFAELLGLKSNGERTVRGWESGEHTPSNSKWEQIQSITTHVPFKHTENSPAVFKFIDLFAGIGGIRIPFQELGGECVFTSEWDKFSQKVYATNFGELPVGDITKISASSIPNHDILLAGFPCQAFSQAGLKKGFTETRGTLFFEIQKILIEKKPKAFLLENVKQLKGHDKGRTLEIILQFLEKNREGNAIQAVPENIQMSDEARKALSTRLNYQVFTKVLRARDFGVPQNRERIFIVGFDKDFYGKDIDFEAIFSWPRPTMLPTRVGDILEDSKNFLEKYTISDKLWSGHKKRKEEHKEKGNGFGYTLVTKDSLYTNTISARYYKDGSEILIDQSEFNKNPRKLTPRECARLQGFPENFIVNSVSDAQAYKQFGNSVCVTVIRAIANQIINAISTANALKAEGKKTKAIAISQKKQIEMFPN